MAVRRGMRTAVPLGLIVGGLAVLGGSPLAGSTPARPSVANVTATTPAETVSQQAQDVDFTNDGVGLPAKVVVGWGGRVTAVWYRPDADVGFRSGRLFASVRDADGAWSNPLAVSQPFSFPSGDRFDVAAGRGRAVSVVWSARFQGAMRVFEAHRNEPGWSGPRVLGRGISPRVAMDGSGETTVMGFHRAPHLVSRTPAGVWSEPRVFSRGLDISHTLAANRAGDEVAMWSQYSGRYGERIKAAFRTRTSHGWPRAATVPSQAVASNGAGLGVDPHGRVLAAWTGRGGSVWWARRSLAGRWSQARKVVGDVGHIGEYGWLDLSVNRHGRGLIRWTAEGGRTYVARYRPGHGVGAPVRLSRHRWPWFVAEGSPHLTADGTAVVAGAMGDSRVAYRWQTPGQPWSAVQRLDAAEAVNSVGSRARRMVVLFQDQGLRARVLDLGVRSRQRGGEAGIIGDRGV
jgi:hypothetical protein